MGKAERDRSRGASRREKGMRAAVETLCGTWKNYLTRSRPRGVPTATRMLSLTVTDMNLSKLSSDRLLNLDRTH
jgi:hypothetical protein